MKLSRTAVLVTLVILSLATLAGCATFPFLVSVRPSGPSSPPASSPPARNTPTYKNGQTAEVTGRIVLDRGKVVLQDSNSPAEFTFVGLQPQEQRTLYGLEGKTVKIRLKVVSSPSARAFNAQFLQVRN